MASGGSHRVVIVGAGFGGLFAARFLGTAPVEVTLVDRTNHHLFQPLLYQVATGILSSGEIAPPTRDVLKRQANALVELAEVTAIDLDARRVTALRPGGGELTLPYDSLVVGAGVGQSYFGHDEFAEFAPGMKTLADALAHRERIFGAFEMAELADDEDERRAWLTFAVVGGGPTGVEVSGQIAELARRALRRNFRRFDPAGARVLLFEGGPAVLASFGDKLSGRGAKDLAKTGVEIHTGSIVTAVDADGVDVKGPDGAVTRYPAKTKIWAAGVTASPLAAMLAEASGAELDRAGRIKVQPDCSLPGHPEAFVVGDMMNLDDLPGVAEVALQTGIHAAKTIRRRLDGLEPKPFKYRDLGSMAAISRRRAVVSVHGVKLSGFAGWIVWLFVHLTFLTGFKNRFKTLISWTLSFVGSGRTERAIVFTEYGK
ncbi:MAG TPA: NAD(P)/FAD-dependent oxidoreductase [Gaiellaceae bacterium]|nr:NAD(P)/FAD-dependent oxidoreductase [Gaiellaceae bacterium]